MFVAWQPGGGMGPLNSATPASFLLSFSSNSCLQFTFCEHRVTLEEFLESWPQVRVKVCISTSYAFFTSFCDLMFYLFIIQSAEISLVSIQTYCLCSLPLHSNCWSRPGYFVFLWLCMAVHGFSLLPVWFVSRHFLLSLHFQLFMFHFGVEGIDFVSCISALGIISCLKHCPSLCLCPQLSGNLEGEKEKN